MPKYIELSSLLEKLQATSIVTDDLYGMGIMSGMDAARKIVAEQPIIDAEPVVHQKLYSVMPVCQNHCSKTIQHMI